MKSRPRKTIPRTRRKPYAEFAEKLEHAVAVAEQAVAEKRIIFDKLDDARKQVLALEAAVVQLKQHNRELLRAHGTLLGALSHLQGVLEHCQPASAE